MSFYGQHLLRVVGDGGSPLQLRTKGAHRLVAHQLYNMTNSSRLCTLHDTLVCPTTPMSKDGVLAIARLASDRRRGSKPLAWPGCYSKACVDLFVYLWSYENESKTECTYGELPVLGRLKFQAPRFRR